MIAHVVNKVLLEKIVPTTGHDEFESSLRLIRIVNATDGISNNFMGRL